MVKCISLNELWIHRSKFRCDGTDGNQVMSFPLITVTNIIPLKLNADLCYVLQ